MGFINTHNITYRDSSTGTICVYTPDSYTNGIQQKWIVLCHGSGLDYEQFFYGGSPYYTAAETYGFVLVGINGELDTNDTVEWLDLSYRPNKRLEDGIALAKQIYSLDDYLPCIYGMSMGGWKTIREMMRNSQGYSAFGASVPPIDLIAWAQALRDNEGLDDISPAFGAEYPSGNPIIDNEWEQNSHNYTASTAILNGRRLWITSAQDDTTWYGSTQHTALTNSIPPGNLYVNRNLVSGGHIDYGPTYINEIFTFFTNDTKALPSAASLDGNGFVTITAWNNATIYYSWDNTENYVQYNNEQLSIVGKNSIQYYASDLSYTENPKTLTFEWNKRVFFQKAIDLI